MKSIKFFIIVLASLMLTGRANAQTDLNRIMQERGEYYFSLDVQQLTEVQTINAMCSVDKLDGKTVICYANQKQFDQLMKHGYQPTLLLPPSMQNEIKMWDGRGAYDWDTYPTYEQYASMMQQFATDHPDRCTYMELGTLPSGRKLMLCRLNNGDTSGKPSVLMSSTIHGDEVTGMMLQLRLIDYLLTSNEEEANFLMDNLDIFIAPNTNPDGTYHGGNNSVSGATRYNSHNIDLNRHFPDWDDGPHPDGASEYESECVWMMDLASEYHFTMGANYHGGAEVMNYPWDTYQPLHPDDDWWVLVSRQYADLVHEHSSNYMTDLNNGITNGYAWYSIPGGRQDYMNYYQECREVTIECSNNKTPSASQMPTFWTYNKEAMLAYMHQAVYGIHGVVTDSVTGQAIEGVNITIQGHDHHGSAVSTHAAGYYHRPIKGGTYTVTYTANGYFPKTYTLTVADNETLVQDVQMVAGEGIIPDFNASANEVAMGGSVNFTDNTWGANLVSWNWQFEGATPATSTLQNPTDITYNEIGSFDVTLTVTNADGESETVTKHDFITVFESYNMQNGTISTCNALFFDHGGQYSNYENNENYTMTFMPATPGAILEINFLEFATESGYDILYVYDGASTDGTQIGQYSGSHGPGLVSATNPEGALTFRFASDYSSTSAGWKATVTCVFDNPLELVSISADPELIDLGESSQLHVEVTGGSGEYTYEWTPAESLDDATSANPVATPETSTTYKVTVSDGISTVADEVTITIRNLSVGEDHSQVKVYPNPTHGSFTIAGCEGMGYTLYNSIGQAILSGKCESAQTQVNAQSLQPGVYFLNVGGKVQKLVIEQ